MASPTRSPEHRAEPGDENGKQPLVVDRRKFLVYAANGTALTIAAYATSQGLAPGGASAQPVPSGPHPIDELDLGDILTSAYKPTMNLMRLEVTEDGRARFELPRTEVGQGITTAFAMVIADELDLPLERVDVPYSDARPEFLYNMLTGGSCSLRALIPTIRSMCAMARGQLVAAAVNQLDYPAGTLQVADGQITAPDGSSRGYGSLSRAAAALPMPAEPPEPKQNASWASSRSRPRVGFRLLEAPFPPPEPEVRGCEVGRLLDRCHRTGQTPAPQSPPPTTLTPTSPTTRRIPSTTTRT